MKTAVVSSAEIFAEPGQPLAARIWVNRKPGESYQDCNRRLAAESALARAEKHLRHAHDRLDEATELLVPPVSDQDAPWANGDWEDPYEDLEGFLETAEDYQRGRY